jgi:hypothetical protein
MVTSPTTHIQRARGIFGILISQYMNCAVVLESECFIGDGGGDGAGGATFKGCGDHDDFEVEIR